MTPGPFVPASRDTNKQRPRLLQAPPPIPAQRLEQMGVYLLVAQILCTPGTHKWTVGGPQSGTRWSLAERRGLINRLVGL